MIATTTPRFNAWTDAWLPLTQEDGATIWASPVELLSGERDGIDLDFPRDDFRAFARLLLSALVQAILPASDKAELQKRLDEPMSRAELDRRLKPVLADFDLFGPHPFLQVPPPAEPPTEGAAPFAFPSEDLFQSRTTVDAISLPIALITLFVEQMYAGGAGRGYGAGPGGQPGALTLITPRSVREGAWANTLTKEVVESLYAKETPQPWLRKPLPARPRSAIGLVGGLFFQPRSAWLVLVPDGQCSFTGREGPLVRLSPLRPGTAQLTKKSDGDLWQHPCAPMAVNSQGIAPIRLRADRPVWTGLAQLLQPLSRQGRKTVAHPRVGPAPVLVQWRLLPGRRKTPRMLVLDFNRDKANIKGRFFESYPLSDALVSKPNTVERMRLLIEDSESVAFTLGKELDRAHDDRGRGGFARPDALAAFWGSTEQPFVAWLSAMLKSEGDGVPDEAAVEASEVKMREALRRTAMQLFDTHAEFSEFDPRKQQQIAKARRRMRQRLWPSLTPKAPPQIEAAP